MNWFLYELSCDTLKLCDRNLCQVRRRPFTPKCPKLLKRYFTSSVCYYCKLRIQVLILKTHTCHVSRIWREVHAFLAHSRIHAAFLKMDDFHAFSGFSSRIHLKVCSMSSITDFLVCIFLPSNVLQHYFRVH